LFSFDLIITFDTFIFWRNWIIEDFQKLTVSLRGNLEIKTNIVVFTFKGQLDAFSEKQFKTFVFNNLKNELPFVIDLTKIDFLDSSGLGALVQTAKECKKQKLGFSVVGNSRVGQTIKLVRLGDFLNLTHLANERAGNLSGGQKKLLELGRTMMVDAKLVLLDEVGAGVNRTLLKDLGTAILKLNKEKNYTFCMIEHDMDFISRMCDPVIVMADGSVLFEGTSEEVKKNEKVIESYLGKSNLTKKEN